MRRYPILVVVLLALSTILGLRPGTAQEATPTGPGALVDVGGRRLSLLCEGTGSPTVLLESGFNDTGAAWSAIQGSLAETTRVCSYDRANVPGGASDPAPAPRTAQDLASDLHALLVAAAIPGPYVLVGHSIGGLFVRVFASTYPDEVVGMVLVDATHEAYWARLELLIGPVLWDATVAQLTQGIDAGFLEPVDLAATAAEVTAADAAGALGPMPLIVLSRTQLPDASTLPPDWPIEAEDRLWQALQDDLATLVPNSRHIAAAGSGHYIQQDRPDLVIHAIQDVVQAVRDPGSWDPATPLA